MKPILAALLVCAGPSMAQNDAPPGDPAAGERIFARCVACHVVTDPDGNTLAGRAGRTGPNLYGVIGRTAGSLDGFRYSTAMTEAGGDGLVWSEVEAVPYLLDPTGFLQDYLGNSRARGRMTFRLRSEDEARDVIAYLRTLGETAPDS